MKLVVWNSQGSKWFTAWDAYAKPYVNAPKPDDVVLMLLESGWAPWVAPGPVNANRLYWLSGEAVYNDRIDGPFNASIDLRRPNRGFWLPWVADPDAAKACNSRCSIGGGIYPRNLTLGSATVYNLHTFRRPVIALPFGKQNTRGRINVSFTIYLVHMVSGSPAKAEAQLVGVMESMESLIPEGTSAIVVGDMNVDLLTAGTMNDLPAHWSILRTWGPTQKSGSELDYGLLFDPNKKLEDAGVIERARYGTGRNLSDHSVLEYDIPVPLS